MYGVKQAKLVEVKFDTVHGKNGDILWELGYNKASKRYALRADDGFLYSHISLIACQNKAADKEVAWA